ncbi:MAG: capsule assembly Wzi family protein [Gemmatimonadaceae bacterium]|nr:capsule assembly Wzi family protein [Gemmatimonadaceae bacterium]
MALGAAALLLSRGVGAQQPLVPASPLSDYVRFLELQGKARQTPLVYWASSTAPSAGGLVVDSAHLWADRYALATRAATTRRFALRILDSQSDIVYNSGFPRTVNDGAAWGGRGLSATVRGGADVTWGPFTGRLYPTVVYAQNRAFPLGTGPASPGSPYAYPWNADIDLPQRFGESAMRRFDWGQSELRVDLKAFTAALSTENLWWGPGTRNAIIMGSAAPGFAHLDIGTGRPLRSAIGDFEVRGTYGELRRSPFAAARDANARRIFTGLTVGYRPSFLPGLTVGAARALYRRWPVGGPGLEDVKRPFGTLLNWGTKRLEDGSVGNDLDDQLASVVARWVLPAARVEVYLEYARNDFAGDLRDLLTEPDHARGYTAGLQKVLDGDAAAGRWVLRAENTNLGQTRTEVVRGGGAFYTHGLVREGYTHRGQLLGAPIGPGSNAQFLGLDRYAADGRFGVFVERIRYDDDYAFPANRGKGAEGGFLNHQLDLTAGASWLHFGTVFDVGGNVEVTRQWNRYYRLRNDLTNLRLGLTLGWHERTLGAHSTVVPPLGGTAPQRVPTH